MSTVYQITRPARVRLLVDQGATFARKFVLRLGGDPFPFTAGHGLSDWSARMDVREAVESESCLLSATTENGRIVIAADGTESSYTIRLDAEATAALPDGEHVYDIELVRASDGFVLRIQEGKVRVRPEVTRGCNG